MIKMIFFVAVVAFEERMMLMLMLETLMQLIMVRTMETTLFQSMDYWVIDIYHPFEEEEGRRKNEHNPLLRRLRGWEPV